MYSGANKAVVYIGARVVLTCKTMRKKIKKTTLQRETVRHLTGDLVRVVGGITDTTSDPYSAMTNCQTPCVSQDANCSVNCGTHITAC